MIVYGYLIRYPYYCFICHFLKPKKIATKKPAVVKKVAAKPKAEGAAVVAKKKTAVAKPAASPKKTAPAKVIQLTLFDSACLMFCL